MTEEKVIPKDDTNEQDYILESFNNIVDEDVEYLWHPYFPKGKFIMIAGDPAVGKTYLTTYIASVVSNGGSFPFSDKNVEKGKVIILNSEDSASELKKRLKKAKANLDNIFMVTSKKGLLRLSNVNVLEKFITENNISLIIVDPVNSFIGNVDTSNDAAFRNAMTPIVSLCDKYNVTLITATHFNKSAEKSYYRINGTIGYVGMPRSVIFVVDSYLEDGNKIFAQQKFSYDGKGKPIIFKISEDGVNWLEQLDSINIDDFTSAERFSLLQVAKDFIIETLENVDEKEAVEFEKEALKNDIQRKTFQNARMELRKAKIINKRIDGKNRKTYWFLISQKEDKTSLEISQIIEENKYKKTRKIDNVKDLSSY